MIAPKSVLQTRDVHQAGAVDQGAARDVHGHRRPRGEPGRDGEQVFGFGEKNLNVSPRIDAHVESAVEYTTRATNDTKKALEYQSKARRKKIMMLLCMIIAGGLGDYMGLKYLGFVG